MKNTNKLTRDILNIGQRSYVTIGKPDGTVADVLMPDTSKGEAGILVYFQNSGHLPAKLNVGTWGPTWGIAFFPKEPEPSIQIDSDRPFTPMWAGRDRRNGGITNSGTTIVAANSVYTMAIVKMERERMIKILGDDTPLQLSGIYDSCDTLGNYSCRQFTIQYFKEPFSKFELVTDNECPRFMTRLMHPDPNIEYFPACEAGDRERQMEESAISKLKKK